jgi:undecaprenyl-diphosphatase
MAACERKGMVSLVFINVFGRSPEEAVSLSIWLHGGTLAAAIYFRLGLSDILSDIPDYIRACPAKKEKGPLIHFLAVSTVISGIIEAPLLLYVTEVSSFSGSVMTGIIGLLLIVTGLLQKKARSSTGGGNEPEAHDDKIAGVAQGLAVLPGVSRSGFTISALLLRVYSSVTAIELSFLMSIPGFLLVMAAITATGSVRIDGGVIASLFCAFVSGYVTISAF